MKLFIDTANLDEIRSAAAWGVLDGCTTNPSLIAKEGRDFAETIHEICEIVKGPVSAEVVAQDKDGMLAQAKLLRRIHEHVVIKLPMSWAGIAACRQLTEEGTETNVTLCFSVSQAILAAKAGATYVSPFVGRLDDTGHDGMELIADIVAAFDRYSFSTEVLAASIRHPAHVLEAVRVGAHVSTMPFKVMKAMVEHPLTDRGNDAFTKDWAKVPGTLEDTVGAFLQRSGR
jgi:transaldolase